MKHLLKWVKSVFGVIEIDARCHRLPPNHNVRLFMKGISCLSQVSGQEHNQICCILLRLIVDLLLPNCQSPARLIRAVRDLLDFLYLAQYPLHSTETLKLLKDALALWDQNKQIFVDLGVWQHFNNIPKLHFLRHYLLSITLYGTTDNYNTEYTERLHIDLAKDAYRSTNHVDEYTQMTLARAAGENLPASRLHCVASRWKASACGMASSWPFPTTKASDDQAPIAVLCSIGWRCW